MKSAVSCGFQQISKKRILLVSSLMSLVIMSVLVDSAVHTYRDGELLKKSFHIKILVDGIRSNTVHSFLPILAVLPCSGIYVDDLKSRFDRFILIRSSCYTYIASRIIVAFLAGGLAILFGVLLAWGTIAAVLAPVEQVIEGVENVSTDEVFDLCILLFINGGFWSITGMALSSLMESKYISYASPFVIYYLLVILYERYLPDAVLLYPLNWTNPDVWPFGALGAVIFLLKLTTICGIVFIMRARKRMREL